MEELQEMMVDQLKDAFSAEKQAIQVMKRTLRKATEPELKKGIEAHIAQSEEQRDRVGQALETLGARPGRKVCEAMRGLAEEAEHEMEEHDKGPLLDVVIVASQQRMEHYEIAAYGTMLELAKATGQDEVADALAEILSQEKEQDERLTTLTRERLLPAVLKNGEDDEDDDEDEEEDDEEEEGKAAAPPKEARGGARPRSGTRKRA